MPEPTQRVLILGAAGRDFHDFNTMYRDDPDVRVVAFTATQIPDIAGRSYPAELAGPHYPEGIPIEPEDRLEELIESGNIDVVVFAYSDVSHVHVMHLAARVNAAGASFLLLGRGTMLESNKPVVSVTAVRTGAGKSQTSRRLRSILQEAGRQVAVVRHPMPYGNLALQRLQRFETFRDLDDADVTIEEREEFEPYLREGAVVFAGSDYEAILRDAEREADVVLWDGGNNDTPFFKPDVDICVVDPLRPGDEVEYWPGEANLRRAGAIIINKVDSADPGGLSDLRATIAEVNPEASVTEAESTLTVDDPDLIEGKRVLVVEDGPTVTHGGMAYGAGYVAALRLRAAEIIDPRPYAVGSLVDVFAQNPHLEVVLPAMGYGEAQRSDLRETIRSASDHADTVVVGTPIDLFGALDLAVPSVRVYYDLTERSGPTLEELLEPVVR